ncbi:beta-galactosidase [Vibrio variabilis]|uniref:Beta-galactosidase n=1 Tax=Vibrio variabilis TaxID=990271 RepID=A0ABQ0JLQ7_9VIBR|nr:beta-galactosidase [Vibrio variabilis]
MGGDTQWPPNEEQLSALAYRNYQHHETQNLAKVNLGASLTEYINNTQQYQRRVNKYAAEQLRLKKNNGIAVIYQFMFVDSWPSITWSVLDDSRNPKPAYFALKESFQPILGIASVNPDSSSKLINVSVINDSRDELSNVTLAVKCGDRTEDLSTCWREKE